MNFKLILALVEDGRTDAVIHAAREAGATGVTVVSNARGEGVKPQKTFFGLSLETQRDLLLMVVEQGHARAVLEKIAVEAEFDTHSGAGIAVQLDVEDTVGVAHQIQALRDSHQADRPDD
ncbi:MAG: P-II family nitrogen regulator [Lysobacterales bacterium]